MGRILGSAPGLEEVARGLVPEFGAVFGRSMAAPAAAPADAPAAAPPWTAAVAS